ncbi:MAG TPA: transposase [Nitrososphaeraceae archaeon]|nr:transposase [Nitrososphaeraceae archaeon]
MIEEKQDKKSAIKASLKATREKRKHQSCKVYTVKFDISHLNNTTIAHLNRLFLEAKWYYNNILSDVFEADDKLKEVPVKVKDVFEIRPLNCLSSQMKQSIIDRAKDNISTLSTQKSNGRKIGKLRYKGEVKTIPLKQFNNTYKILNNKYIKIQGIKQKIKVIGLKQIPEGSDFANANLIHRNDDYYLKITTYQEKLPKEISIFKSVGIDFNIGKQLVWSNGIEIQYNVEVTPKLKRIARKLSKQELHSKNWNKTRIKLDKEYEKATNIKQDISNKIVSHLKDTYEIVCFQDENLKAWQRIWGRRMLATSLGGIIDALKQSAHTPIEVNKFYPSTKTCSKCGNIQDVSLSERTYVCEKCGHIINRDHNSSINILKEGLKSIGMVHTELAYY